jgi:hypothetical protein
MFITIPPDVEIKIAYLPNGQAFEAYAVDDPEAPANGDDGRPWPVTTTTFVRDFLRRILLNDPSWGKSMDQVYASEEIRGAFHGKGPGDVVMVSKAQHDLLVAVMRAPANGYPPVVAPMLTSFFRAIETADVKAPGPTAIEPHPQPEG